MERYLEWLLMACILGSKKSFGRPLCFGIFNDAGWSVHPQAASGLSKLPYASSAWPLQMQPLQSSQPPWSHYTIWAIAIILWKGTILGMIPNVSLRIKIDCQLRQLPSSESTASPSSKKPWRRCSSLFCFLGMNLSTSWEQKGVDWDLF